MPVQSPPRPTTDRREQKQAAIIEAAARLFAEAGYAECEMERVAAAAGVAKGTLYLYFPSKQDLFFACVDWGMKRMQEAIRASIAGTREPFEQIARAIRAYLAFFETHPQYVELIIQERAIFRDRKRPTYFEHRDAYRGYWRDLYARLIAEGRLRSDLSVENILDAIGSLVYGTMFTNHFIGRAIPAEAQANAILETVFRGVLSDEERKSWLTP